MDKIFDGFDSYSFTAGVVLCSLVWMTYVQYLTGRFEKLVEMLSAENKAKDDLLEWYFELIRRKVKIIIVAPRAAVKHEKRLRSDVLSELQKLDPAHGNGNRTVHLRQDLQPMVNGKPQED